MVSSYADSAGLICPAFQISVYLNTWDRLSLDVIQKQQLFPEIVAVLLWLIFIETTVNSWNLSGENGDIFLEDMLLLTVNVLSVKKMKSHSPPLCCAGGWYLNTSADNKGVMYLWAYYPILARISGYFSSSFHSLTKFPPVEKPWQWIPARRRQIKRLSANKLYKMAF